MSVGESSKRPRSRRRRRPATVHPFPGSPDDLLADVSARRPAAVLVVELDAEGLASVSWSRMTYERVVWCERHLQLKISERLRGVEPPA